MRLCNFEAKHLTESYVAWLNDPVTVRYSNQRFVAHSIASCTQYWLSFKDSPNYFFSIHLKDSGQAIGTMTAYCSPHHGTADMGILLGERSVWGRGLGLDAWCMLQKWLLTQKMVRKVTAGTLSCNAPMLKVMSRSGMVHEGTRFRQEVVDGAEQDMLYFARFADG